MLDAERSGGRRGVVDPRRPDRLCDVGAQARKDNVQSYTTVEPAIDLTASSPLAFSWQVAPATALPG